MCQAAIGCVCLGIWVGCGAALAVAAAAVAYATRRLVLDVREQRGLRARRCDVQNAVRVLCAELDAGSSPPAALSAVVAVTTTLRSTFADAASVALNGGDSAAVIAREPALATVAEVWRIGIESGTASAQLLTRLADELDADAQRRRDVAVVLAGPRASMAVLAGLPALGLALGAAMGADPLGYLFGASSGRFVCCAGVVLDAAGVLWAQHILRRSAPP